MFTTTSTVLANSAERLAYSIRSEPRMVDFSTLYAAVFAEVSYADPKFDPHVATAAVLEQLRQHVVTSPADDFDSLGNPRSTRDVLTRWLLRALPGEVTDELRQAAVVRPPSSI
jgi:hypothetical protein